jgi:aspartyl-tRNA synthetase
VAVAPKPLTFAPFHVLFLPQKQWEKPWNHKGFIRDFREEKVFSPMHPYRTHSCGELFKSHVDEEVRLSGWVHRKRDHGGLLFVDLRDHYGLTQCVIEPENPEFAKVDSVRNESVIKVTGRVVARTEETTNKNLPTGEIEVRIETVEVLSMADDLPLPVFAEPEYPEDIRLTNRFLDLRRETLHENIVKRSKIIREMRLSMEDQGFTEYQTPILTASSPEGARDFLVPSRLYPGEFFALPQAPQQFKQLIMVSGFDRYFQVAPCFRDEDARADRSPGEFYQLDVEMSFVTQEDVLDAVGKVSHDVFETFSDDYSVTALPFPQIPYAESLLKYGNDKPDLRNPIEIADVTECFMDETVSFKAFRSVIESGGVVRGIPAPGAATQPRSFFDKLNNWARKEMDAPGLGYVILEEGDGGVTGKGPIAKFIPEPVLQKMADLANVKAGDALFFACDQVSGANRLAGEARTKIGWQLELVDEKQFNLCWIVDYPIYEYDEREKKIDFSHNPFSMPNGGMEALENQDPLEILGQQYDLVCNGYELGSGAIRNHEPETMVKAFEIAGYKREQTEREFSGMINAFKYGAPPHGGFAIGIDRVVMLLARQVYIREVTMFPMTQQAQDLLMNAPSPANDEQLKELHIRVQMPLVEKKEE